MALGIIARGSTDKKLGWAFGLYDDDGNGKLTREELVDMFQVESRELSPLFFQREQLQHNHNPHVYSPFIVPISSVCHRNERRWRGCRGEG